MNQSYLSELSDALNTECKIKKAISYFTNFLAEMRERRETMLVVWKLANDEMGNSILEQTDAIIKRLEEGLEKTQQLHKEFLEKVKKE